jgi:hypothetical protein
MKKNEVGFHYIRRGDTVYNDVLRVGAVLEKPRADRGGWATGIR